MMELVFELSAILQLCFFEYRYSIDLIVLNFGLNPVIESIKPYWIVLFNLLIFWICVYLMIKFVFHDYVLLLKLLLKLSTFDCRL